MTEKAFIWIGFVAIKLSSLVVCVSRSFEINSKNKRKMLIVWDENKIGVFFCRRKKYAIAENPYSQCLSNKAN